jgi:hypothetical protein
MQTEVQVLQSRSAEEMRRALVNGARSSFGGSPFFACFEKTIARWSYWLGITCVIVATAWKGGNAFGLRLS